MVSSDKSADCDISSDQQRVSLHSDVTVSQEIHDIKVHSSIPGGARRIPSIVAKNEVKYSDATACTLQSDQEGTTYSVLLEKSPDTLSCPLQSGQDSPAIVREKVSQDGYNWRKYGQKHVKGNEFIRNYYKCTHPNCKAKKQLEQSNNGQITDSICIGEHNHPKPQLNTAQPVDCVLPVVEVRPDKPPLANVEDKASIEHGCMPEQIEPSDSLPISKVSPSDGVKGADLQLIRAKDEVHNKEDSDSKRLKKDNSNADVIGVEKSTHESRVVVQTSSEVDFVNDGYRWRKYGQKLVKGNPNPRSYYRCSNPGCTAKKHVERASHDSKIVITAYEGQHDHEIPPGRTLTHNAATYTHTMANNGKPGAKSGGTNACDDRREHSSLDSDSRLNDKLNGESVTKSKLGDTVESHEISLGSECPESKLSEQEQQHGNSGAKVDSVTISNDIICHPRSEVPCRSNEQKEDELKTKSEASKLNKQSTTDTKPVQS